MSWSFKGSEGKGGKGGNKPEGGGSPPIPLALLSGNLGKAGIPGMTPPTPGELLPPPDPPKEDPKTWAAAADTGGRPGILGILNPGGKTGVIPAMGLLAIGAMGSPFFSASSINCNNGG